MTRLLLVEDDPGIVRSLSSALKLEGYDVTTAGTLKAARAVLEKEAFDLLILDVNLPDGSGFELCAEVRENEVPVPIVMLTARADEGSAVRGLNAGADDYLRKPVGSEELLARLKKHLKHRRGRLKFGDLVLDLDHHSAVYVDKDLGLTRREFEILFLLMKAKGTVVTREALMRAVDKEGKILDSTLESHLSHLRGKLKRSADGAPTVSSVYGVGYRLERK